jgi:hypothetical protein
MHFTVVFSGHESCDLSYGLVFIPCPVWIRDEEEILNLHPEDPHYKRGDLRLLLDKEAVASSLHEDQRRAVIIVHPSGHGSLADVALLQEDLRAEGFSFHMLSLADATG